MELNPSVSIVACPNKTCNQRLRVPNDRGILNVTCPSCKFLFEYTPQGYNKTTRKERKLSSAIWFLKKRRLWMVEKPLLLFYQKSLLIWKKIIIVWMNIIHFLNNDNVSFKILSLSGFFTFIILLVMGRSEVIDIAVKIILFIIVILVFFMVFSRDKSLRWLIPLLSVPIWVPPLFLILVSSTIVTSIFLAISIILTPLGALAMLIGIVYSCWRSHHGITVRCTKGECHTAHRRFRDLEVNYLCPGGCGASYGFLIPSHLGLLYHTCTCGARLPAPAFLRKRVNKDGKTMESTLIKVCPSGHPWGIGSNPLPSHFVAIVGGPSAGKTCYMTMAIQCLTDGALINSPSDNHQFQANFESGEDRRNHSDRYEVLSKGIKLPPTQRGIPDAMVLRLSANGNNNGDSRLYLYDAAGEEYSPQERRSDEDFEFFEDLTGAILLVDPLVLPKLQEYVKNQAIPTVDALGVSSRAFGVVVGGLQRYVDRFLKYGHSGRKSVPLAVVITKTDVPIINDRVGTWAICQSDENEHGLCRKALIEWGAINEIIALEQDFPQVRYFSCSSLGRTPDGKGRPFIPERVLPPMLWLFEADM